MYFNGTFLTKETINKTRQWFHDNCISCIEEVKNGKACVNDSEYYTKWQMKEAKAYLEGRHDHVIAFLQRAYYIQTGKSVALLP